jgi:hypothetical protein
VNPALSLPIRIVAIGVPRGVGDLDLVAVAVGVDSDDGVDHLCHHGHTASCSFQGWGRNVRTGLGGVTEGHICDGSQASDQANTVGQVGVGDPGTGQKKGTHTRPDP